MQEPPQTPSQIKTTIAAIFSFLSPLNPLSVTARTFSARSRRALRLLRDLALQFYREVDAMELLFIRMSALYAFASQLLFFMSCETALDGPFHRPLGCRRKLINSLTSVLFYTIFGYFVAKAREIYEGGRGGGRRGALWAIFKVLVEWLKAVAVAVSLREQGLRYQQGALYATLTFSYYFCTEKLFLETVPCVMAKLNLEILDDLEHLYVPTFMNCYALLVGVLVTAHLSNSVYASFALSSAYFLVYLRLKDLYCNYVKTLNVERRTFASFRHATEKELEEWNDICAVCLSSMSRAKITPCNHLFHPRCLKQCLKMSFKCPLCKRGLL